MSIKRAPLVAKEGVYVASYPIKRASTATELHFLTSLLQFSTSSSVKAHYASPVSIIRLYAALQLDYVQRSTLNSVFTSVGWYTSSCVLQWSTSSCSSVVSTSQSTLCILYYAVITLATSTFLQHMKRACYVSTW